jgi:hypothetical protein
MIDPNEKSILQLRLLGRTCDPTRWLRIAGDVLHQLSFETATLADDHWPGMQSGTKVERC